MSPKTTGGGFGANLRLRLLAGDQSRSGCLDRPIGPRIRRKTPAEGKIRVDLSINELLQLSWLAHLGFQHMMPNYRGFEIYRFSSETDAQEGARAVGKIEGVIPAKDRPVALEERAPISGWIDVIIGRQAVAVAIVILQGMGQ
jgi:hypothetical protein